jgi:YggT family protein
VPYIVFRVIDTIFTLLYVFILIRVVLSFISVPINGVTRPVLNFIYDVTEPIMKLVRNIIPPITVGGVGLDLSPIIAIFLLRIVNSIIDIVLRLFIP